MRNLLMPILALIALGAVGLSVAHYKFHCHEDGACHSHFVTNDYHGH